VKRVGFGTDEVTGVTEAALAHLIVTGHRVVLVANGLAWPDVGRGVGEVVAGGRADVGIVCCHTGTGVSIAANKVPGVRAALCVDAETARNARRWNDANVLALALGSTTAEQAREIIDAFLATGPDPAEAATIARLGP